MARDGGLATFLRNIDGGWLSTCSARARAHAEAHFSKTEVIRQYMNYYRDILAAGAG